MKEKVLVIAYYSSYKNVTHAGGKINYYYTNKLIENDYDVTFIGRISEDEIKKYEVGKLNCRQYVFTLTRGINSIRQFVYKVGNKINKYNLFDKYCGKNNFETRYFINTTLKKLSNEQYTPDIVVLDWVESGFFLSKVKKFFPKAKVIIVEQDVYYLNLQRKIDNAKRLKKTLCKKQYRNFKKFELNILRKVDQIEVLNGKDKRLLVDDGIDVNKIKIVAPYFDLFEVASRNKIDKNILFYGAMNREENEQAVLWFIDTVMPLLDKTFRFIIVGNKPSEKLLGKVSERVIVTGFVEDVLPYFETALCLVVPLFVGAGIKIKVLEGMSAGVPVLTNDVGIEGIDAVDGKEYFYCKDAADYAEKIKLLDNNRELCNEIGKNGQKFIIENFNYKTTSYV
ncbi:glycosyltransferase [Treponema sp.]|uniref:glycosyltransferase n=1 Tax=Treponema sp. TaxID=166 RepID=UPI00257DE4A4|nr:glycosyltransferase [Treponema sp.]